MRERNRVERTDGRRERIRGMVGGRYGRQPEQSRDHPPNLSLVGPTAAADRRLHLLRRVGMGRQAMLASREQHDTSCLTDRERCADICAEVQLLDRDTLDLEPGDQCSDVRVDLGEPSLQRDPGTGLDHAPVECAQAASGAVDDAESCIGCPWVDTEHDHVFDILRGRSDACREAGELRGANCAPVVPLS